MNRVLIAAIAATACFAGNAIAGPSAKFAAVYGDQEVNLLAMAQVSGSVDASDFDRKNGYTFATIKIPQDKEILVGISAEVGLTTDTSVKGKNGGEARAIAGALGKVIVVAHRIDDPNCGPGVTNYDCGTIAKPGEVTLNSRVQALEARLGGVIEQCTDGFGDNGDPTDGVGNDPDGTIDVETECVVTDEEIALMQETLSSHHFNFVLPDMEQGEYDITAYFTTEASAEIDICDSGDSFCEEDPSGTVEAAALAHAWIGKYMVTAQQVRAVKNSIDNEVIEIIE